MQRSTTTWLAATAGLLMASSSAYAAGFWTDAAKPYAGTTIRGVSESTPPSNFV
jgi:multiple sugar transport system substrate-binding protein